MDRLKRDLKNRKCKKSKESKIFTFKESNKKPNAAFNISPSDIEEVFGKNFGDIKDKTFEEGLKYIKGTKEYKDENERYLIKQIILVILKKLGGYAYFVEEDLLKNLQGITSCLNILDEGEIVFDINQSKYNEIINEMIYDKMIISVPFVDCHNKLLCLVDPDLKCISAKVIKIIEYALSSYMIPPNDIHGINIY